MKEILTIIALFVSFACFGQKIKPYEYGVIDTLYKHKDAQVLVYKNESGKVKKDTIYYSRMKSDLYIRVCNVVIIDNNKKLNQSHE